MSETTKRDAALIQQMAWKPEVIQFAVAVVSRGIELYKSGVTFFGSDDVPIAPAGSGVSGSVMHFLKVAHVIKNCYHHKPEEGIIYGRRPSKRPKSNGAHVCIYELCSMTAAEEFLKRNGKEVNLVQKELF